VSKSRVGVGRGRRFDAFGFWFDIGEVWRLFAESRMVDDAKLGAISVASEDAVGPVGASWRSCRR
jgi:hypothetical protein